MSSGTTSQLLWEESTFWMLSSTISFRILIHQWVPLHCIFSLKLSNGSLSRLEAKKYSSISYFKSRYKPLLTISFPLVITFRLKFPGKMVYPPIPSSNHGPHHFVEGDALPNQIDTFSSLAYLCSFLNFNFIKFSLNDSYLYLLSAMWKVIQGLWIKEKT